MLNGTILDAGSTGHYRPDTQCEVCGKAINYPDLLKIKSVRI